MCLPEDDDGAAGGVLGVATALGARLGAEPGVGVLAVPACDDERAESFDVSFELLFPLLLLDRVSSSVDAGFAVLGAVCARAGGDDSRFEDDTE